LFFTAGFFCDPAAKAAGTMPFPGGYLSGAFGFL